MHHEWQIPLVERMSSIVRLVEALHPLITSFCAESVSVGQCNPGMVDSPHGMPHVVQAAVFLSHHSVFVRMDGRLQPKRQQGKRKSYIFCRIIRSSGCCRSRTQVSALQASRPPSRLLLMIDMRIDFAGTLLH
jgi:hypothetical protein